MREKVISILFVCVLFSFSILGLVFKDREYSSYERRRLASVDDLKDDFFENLDDYLTDQMPFRDSLISLSSIYNRYFLQNKESNSVYLSDGYIIEKNYPLDEKSLANFIKKINYINKEYLSNSNVYYMIIPDKAYFLDESKYLKLDYDKVFSELKDGVNANYIDIVSLLKLEDYFKTDIHIKQDSYFKVLKELDKFLDFDYKDLSYEENVFNDFYGASYSKVSKYYPSEELVYLTSDRFKGVKVNHLEFGEKDIYDLDKLGEIDSYNVFLSGPSALIRIENPRVSEEKELIVFRDSFSSSLVPLLIPFYSKITMIDLRYINMENAINYVDFDSKDVIFIYSTLIVNSSNILKVNAK